MTLQDFNRLKVEFFETYEDLTMNAHSQLEKTLRLKVLAIQSCIEQYHEYRSKYHQLFEGNVDDPAVAQSVQYKLKCYNYTQLYHVPFEDIEESIDCSKSQIDEEFE